MCTMQLSSKPHTGVKGLSIWDGVCATNRKVGLEGCGQAWQRRLLPLIELTLLEQLLLVQLFGPAEGGSGGVAGRVSHAGWGSAA